MNDNSEGYTNLVYLLLNCDGAGKDDPCAPYFVGEEGGVLTNADAAWSFQQALVYDADGVTRDEAAVIVKIYNRFGGDHAWLFIEPIIALYLEGEKNHQQAEGDYS